MFGVNHLIPGQLISILTFPGVILHEAAHVFICKLLGVVVFEVKFFRIGNPSGYVIHEAPRKFSHQILICFAPFLLNSILGSWIGASAGIPLFHPFSGSAIDYFLLWLGFSIALHCLPSTTDAQSLWKRLWQIETGILEKFIGFPIAIFAFAGSYGGYLLLDGVYALAIIFILPKLLARLF